MDADTIYAAHVDEVVELGWETVAARMDRWEMYGYEGDWQDPEYDLPPDWSWPTFGAAGGSDKEEA